MSRDENQPLTDKLPILSLRDVVVYPHMVIPLFVGRKRSVQALEHALETDKKILLVTQKDSEADDPAPKGLYKIGCIANLLQLFKLPDGTVKVLVEGLERVYIGEVINDTRAQFATTSPAVDEKEDPRELEVMVRSAHSQFEQYVKLNKKIPPEVLTALAGIDDPSRMADTIAAHMILKISEKQEILETLSVLKRFEKLMTMMESEIDLMQVERRIRSRVKRQMEKTQREYYLLSLIHI